MPEALVLDCHVSRAFASLRDPHVSAHGWTKAAGQTVFACLARAVRRLIARRYFFR